MQRQVDEIKSTICAEVIKTKVGTLWNSLIHPPKAQDYYAMAAVLPQGFENSRLLYRMSRDG